MSRDRRNIARIGRGIAGMTQERWAEALGYSVRTVAAWELGEQQISSEAVVRMVDVTGQQVLAYWYLVDSLELPALSLTSRSRSCRRPCCRCCADCGTSAGKNALTT